MKLELIRDLYTKTETLGKLYIDGKYYCEVLEDTVRAMKIIHETAIPKGIYTVEVTMSNRFKRLLPLIYNTKDKTVNKDGMLFEGIRMHSGNTNADSSGCLILAKHRKIKTPFGKTNIMNWIFDKGTLVEDLVTKLGKGLHTLTIK